jgi:hypothetical protein
LLTRKSSGGHQANKKWKPSSDKKRNKASPCPNKAGRTAFCNWKISYKKKQWRPPSQKKKRRKKPKPEEQEGIMPQRQHCPPEKRRGDKNPESHEEQQKDVA